MNDVVRGRPGEPGELAVFESKQQFGVLQIESRRLSSCAAVRDPEVDRMLAVQVPELP
jgi:hypothetical protein